MNRYLIPALYMLACAPTASYTTLPYQPPKKEEVINAINIGLCTAADITPEAVSLFNLFSGSGPSTSDKVFGSILSGASAIGKSLACYMKSMATQRSQAGEVSAAQRSDREIMQARSDSCNPASQAYNLEICKDPRKLASFLLLKYEMAGLIRVE